MNWLVSEMQGEKDRKEPLLKKQDKRFLSSLPTLIPVQQDVNVLSPPNGCSPSSFDVRAAGDVKNTIQSSRFSICFKTSAAALPPSTSPPNVLSQTTGHASASCRFSPNGVNKTGDSDPSEWTTVKERKGSSACCPPSSCIPSLPLPMSKGSATPVVLPYGGSLKRLSELRKEGCPTPTRALPNAAPPDQHVRSSFSPLSLASSATSSRVENATFTSPDISTEEELACPSSRSTTGRNGKGTTAAMEASLPSRSATGSSRKKRAGAMTGKASNKLPAKKGTGRRTTKGNVAVKPDGSLYEYRWYTDRGRRVFVYHNKSYKGKQAYTMWEAVKRLAAGGSVPPLSTVAASAEGKGKKRSEEEERISKMRPTQKRSAVSRKSEGVERTIRRVNRKEEKPFSLTHLEGGTTLPAGFATDQPCGGFTSVVSSSVSVTMAAFYKPSSRSRLAVSTFSSSPLFASSVSNEWEKKEVECVSRNRSSDAPFPSSSMSTASSSLPHTTMLTPLFSESTQPARGASSSSVSSSSSSFPTSCKVEKELENGIVRTGRGLQGGKEKVREIEKETIVISSSESDTEEGWPPPSAVLPLPSVSPAPSEELPPAEHLTSPVTLVLPQTSYFSFEEEEPPLRALHSPIMAPLGVGPVPTPPREEKGENDASYVTRFAPTTNTSLSSSFSFSLQAERGAANTVHSTAQPEENKRNQRKRAIAHSLHNEDTEGVKKRRFRHTMPGDSCRTSFSDLPPHSGIPASFTTATPPLPSHASSSRISSSGTTGCADSIPSQALSRPGLQFIGVHSSTSQDYELPSVVLSSSTLLFDKKCAHPSGTVQRTSSTLPPPVTAMDGSYGECLTLDALDGLNLDGMIDTGEEVGAMRFR